MSQLSLNFERISTHLRNLESAGLFPSRVADCLTFLQETVIGGGRIFIANDGSSRFAATHFAEELQARFRAGSKFQRPDRPAVAAFWFAQGTLQDVAAKDCVIRFCSHVVTCERQGQPTLNLVLEAPLDATATVQAVLQRFVLHASCEPFEPENKGIVSWRNIVGAALSQSATAFAETATDSVVSEIFTSMLTMLREAKAAQSSVVLCGNGGSCVDAQHLAEVWRQSGLLAFDAMEPGFLTCCLNDGLPLFQRAVEPLEAHALLFCLSTSGNSKNVIDAVQLANQKGVRTMVLSGESGGQLRSMATSMLFPSSVTERIQELHLAAGLCVAEALKGSER